MAAQEIARPFLFAMCLSRHWADLLGSVLYLLSVAGIGAWVLSYGLSWGCYRRNNTDGWLDEWCRQMLCVRLFRPLFGQVTLSCGGFGGVFVSVVRVICNRYLYG